MPQATYTADGGHYRVGGVGFDPGDTKTIDEELASYLDDHRDFEVESGDSDRDPDVGESNSAASEAFAGEGFSESDWLANDYQDRAEAVTAGNLDDSLDAVEAVETSDTVLEAVDDRRAELAED
ncbi:hypothetical protein [Halorussus salinus]|uniref:hypothetical protein n=1 Tax=Halorussus salinus TaxID=1364935 RepID=UPI0010926CFD|nr:hypothetical protein [Halorussus salinus]